MAEYLYEHFSAYESLRYLWQFTVVLFNFIKLSSNETTLKKSKFFRQCLKIWDFSETVKKYVIDWQCAVTKPKVNNQTIQKVCGQTMSIYFIQYLKATQLLGYNSLVKIVALLGRWQKNEWYILQLILANAYSVLFKISPKICNSTESFFTVCDTSSRTG